MDPIQIDLVLVTIGTGLSAVIVTVAVAIAVAVPRVIVYVIVEVPADIPFTTPSLPTVAIAGLLLLQTPPVKELARVEVEPTHKEVEPEIRGFKGIALTVILIVATSEHPFTLLTL